MCGVEGVFVLQGRRQLALPSTQLIAAPGWLAARPTLGPGTKPCPEEVGGQRGRGPARRSPFASLGPPPHLRASPSPGSVQFPPGPAPASPALAGGGGGAAAFRGGGWTRRSGWGSARMRRRGPEKQAGAADLGAGSTEERRGVEQRREGVQGSREREGAETPGKRRGRSAREGGGAPGDGRGQGQRRPAALGKGTGTAGGRGVPSACGRAVATSRF